MSRISAGTADSNSMRVVAIPARRTIPVRISSTSMAAPARFLVADLSAVSRVVMAAAS
jgi:hypothetical protein